MAGVISGPLDVNVLCAAFNGTLDANKKTRKAAELLLHQLSVSPGLLLLVSTILTSPDVDIGTRTVAAVFLKNEVRRHWDKSEFDERKTYAEDEKAAFRNLLLPLTEAVVADGIPVAITNSIEDCIRCITHADFPEKWPSVLPVVLERLQQRTNINSLKAALLILLRLVRKYEFRPSESKQTINEIVTSSFPLLLALGGDLCKDDGFATNVSSWLLKMLCKIYWSSTQMVLASGETILATMDDWMKLIEHIIHAPVPLHFIRESIAEPYKTKKSGLQVVHRLLTRYGPSPFRSRSAKEGTDKTIGEKFIKSWSCRFIDSFVTLLKAELTDGVWMSDRMKDLILQYLTQSLELSLTYKSLKPHLPFALYEVCFPLLCYTTRDVELWRDDPSEFIRSRGETVLSGGPRDCAFEFVQSLARIRGRDCLDGLFSFVQTILVEQQQASVEGQIELHNKRKDGALYMIAAMADRLTSKKRQSRVEPFLIQFVLPELTNPSDPFLRLRACWTYGQFLDHQRNRIKAFEHPLQLHEAFFKVVALCSDSELPIRVEAANTLKVFFDIEQEEVRAVVSSHIPECMGKLLIVMSEVPDNEMIVATLESLVLNFESQIPPHAVQLLSYLGSAFIRMITLSQAAEQQQLLSLEDDENKSPMSVYSVSSSQHPYDDDNCSLTAMSVMSTILSVLSTLTEPQFRPIYEQLCPYVVPLLDVTLSPAGLDYAENGLALLTYLTFYCPNLSTPTDLWRYYERCYQAVCGGSSAHLTLEETLAHGWAPDELDEMLPALDNLISRDQQRFLTGISTIEGKSFKQLFLEMVTKCIVTLTDGDLPKYATEFMMLLFEGFIGKAPAVDDLMGPCFQLVTNTALQNHMSIVVRFLSTLIVYNPVLLFQLAEARGLTDEVFRILSDVNTVRTYEGKRVVVLALALVIDQLLSRSASGSALSGLHTPNMIRAISTQLKQLIELTKKKEDAEFEDESDDDSSSDSEQDVGEHEDAGKKSNEVQQKLLAKVIERAAANENDSDDGDGDDDDEDYIDTEAATDNFPIRDSPIDSINELDIVGSLLQRMPSVFTDVLGVVETEHLKHAIVVELERRKSKTTSTSAEAPETS